MILQLSLPRLPFAKIVRAESLPRPAPQCERFWRMRARLSQEAMWLAIGRPPTRIKIESDTKSCNLPNKHAPATPPGMLTWCANGSAVPGGLVSKAARAPLHWHGGPPAREKPAQSSVSTSARAYYAGFVLVASLSGFCTATTQSYMIAGRT